MKYEEIERCKKIAQQVFGIAPEVEVSWDMRGLTAGWCMYQPDGTSKIRLNGDIALAEGDAFVSTIAHEYAHAVDWALDFKAGMLRKQEHHGWQWRRIMRAFGYPPVRCHSFESAVAVRHVEKFKYRCACGPVQLVGPKVHKKLQQGAMYFCRRCKARLIAEPEMSMDDILSKFK